MSYPKVQLIEHTRLVDISASNQTLPYVTSMPMVVYGFMSVATEAYGTIDTGVISLSIGGTTVSTITPVTSDAVGKARQGTNMKPVKVASGATINVLTTQDASQTGTSIIYLLAEPFPALVPA